MRRLNRKVNKMTVGELYDIADKMLTLLEESKESLPGGFYKDMKNQVMTLAQLCLETVRNRITNNIYKTSHEKLKKQLEETDWS